MDKSTIFEVLDIKDSKSFILSLLNRHNWHHSAAAIDVLRMKHRGQKQQLLPKQPNGPARPVGPDMGGFVYSPLFCRNDNFADHATLK